MPARFARALGARKVPARYESRAPAAPLLALALRAHKAGDFASAAAGYKRHLERAPNSLDAWLNLGTAYARIGNAFEARAAFTQAHIYAGNNGRALRDIGIGLAVIGELSSGCGALTEAVRVTPELTGAWLHLGRIAIDAGDRQTAMAAAQRATELAPHDASAHFLLARCSFQHEERAKALVALRRAVQCPSPRAEAGLLLSAWERAEACPQADIASKCELVPERSAQLAYADAVQYMTREMAQARLFASTQETLLYAAEQAPAGNVVELGVRHGVSLRWLSLACAGSVHGFDSFAGLPQGWQGAPAGTFSTDHQAPRDLAARYWVGAFAEQLPKYVAAHPEPIGLLHVDSDLYASARTGFEHLAPRMHPGSVIAFDEYFGHRTWREDEYRAFAEACAWNDWRYEYLAANPFTGQAVVRLLG